MSAPIKILRLIAFILLFLLALCMTLPFDELITGLLTNLPDILMKCFEILARLGESDWMLIPTLAVWLICLGAVRLPIDYWQRWKVRSIGAMSGFIFVSVAIPGATAALLKVAIGRARPIMMSDFGVLYFYPFAGDWRFASFPSGHATTAFALAWSLVFLFGKRAHIAFWGAGLIALSRIVDSAHYASDVLAGIVLGTVGAFAVHISFSARGLMFTPNTKGASNRMLRPVFRKSPENSR